MTPEVAASSFWSGVQPRGTRLPLFHLLLYLKSKEAPGKTNRLRLQWWTPKNHCHQSLGTSSKCFFSLGSSSKRQVGQELLFFTLSWNSAKVHLVKLKQYGKLTMKNQKSSDFQPPNIITQQIADIQNSVVPRPRMSPKRWGNRRGRGARKACTWLLNLGKLVSPKFQDSRPQHLWDEKNDWSGWWLIAFLHFASWHSCVHQKKRSLTLTICEGKVAYWSEDICVAYGNMSVYVRLYNQLVAGKEHHLIWHDQWQMENKTESLLCWNHLEHHHPASREKERACWHSFLADHANVLREIGVEYAIQNFTKHWCCRSSHSTIPGQYELLGSINLLNSLKPLSVKSVQNIHSTQPVNQFGSLNQIQLSKTASKVFRTRCVETIFKHVAHPSTCYQTLPPPAPSSPAAPPGRRATCPAGCRPPNVAM